jgi:membrane protease subunit (stomatin/prohibitin family)
MAYRIIDVIEWTDQGPNDIVQRVPEDGQGDIRYGSQLVVRPSQIAFFWKEGRATDRFTDGRYTLNAKNLPILTGILKLGTNDKTPFPAETYFVSTRDFVGMKWGTAGEITVRDTVLGVAQLKAFGTYSMKIAEPEQFLNQVVGVQGIYTTHQINDYLRDMLLSEIASALGSLMQTKSLLDLAALQSELGDAIQAKATDDFAAIGIALKKVYVVSIQPNEETAKALATRSAMGALGVNYMQYQGAQAMREAAQNPGGGAIGAGMGLGAGIGLGGAISQAIASGMTQTPPQSGIEGAGTATATSSSSSSGVTTKKQIREALTKLDIRLANGDISEATYNKLQANLEKALESAPE